MTWDNVCTVCDGCFPNKPNTSRALKEMDCTMVYLTIGGTFGTSTVRHYCQKHLKAFLDAIDWEK